MWQKKYFSSLLPPWFPALSETLEPRFQISTPRPLKKNSNAGIHLVHREWTFIGCLLYARHSTLFFMYASSFNLQPYDGEIMIAIYLELKDITFAAHITRWKTARVVPSGCICPTFLPSSCSEMDFFLPFPAPWVLVGLVLLQTDRTSLACDLELVSHSTSCFGSSDWPKSDPSDNSRNFPRL